MDKVTVVEFIRSCGVYRAGERAGFDAPHATAYVRQGIARMVSEDVAKVGAAPAPEARRPVASTGGK